MGKIYRTQQQLQEQNQENQTSSSSSSSTSQFCCCIGGCCSNAVLRVRDSFSSKCVLILILSVALLLSAIFWIPPFNRLKSGFDSNAADTVNVKVKASFKLQKPVSFLIPHTERLEYDILGEIGVPNTKVSIVSMHEDATSNWTDVVFAVLPDPGNVPINLVSLSVLKSSMVELFLQRLNLSLTTSIFGEPLSFEILKFSGGVTVVPVPSAYLSKIPQILFNFTLNNSISQVEDSFGQFRDQLKYGLYLRPYENVYVQLRNTNGSTIESPVIVEASVLSDIGTHYLLPQRLKQLAQTITMSPPAKNLGLDHSVFGKVKGISLSSTLDHTLRPSPGSPSPSPSPSSSPSPSPLSSPSSSPSPAIIPYPAPSPIYVPSPSGDHHDLSPYAPSPQPPSPAPSVLNNSPKQSPCHGSVVAPSPVPTPQLQLSSPPSLSPRAPSPSPSPPTVKLPPVSPPHAVSPGTHHDHGSRRSQAPVLPERASSPSPSSSSAPNLCYKGSWLVGVVAWLIHHLLQPYR